MIIEPILREPGSVSFSWMEIQRTKASLVQQIEQQTNFTSNETLLEFGLFPKDGDCEHKCPELDACIASNLWCDGKYLARVALRMAQTRPNLIFLCASLSLPLVLGRARPLCLHFQGYPNCPSGYDESSSECGATRKLLELPAGLFAALGCLAAGIAACLIFCMVGIVRRRKPPPEPKHPAQTTTVNGTYMMPKTNGDTLKKESLFYNHDHDS